MSAQVQLDYFYGAEADNFTFFRIPKKLFRDERYRTLSDGAKILYGLMLDRLQLSIRNNWFDDRHRAYIRYSVEQIMEDMDCCNQKAVRLLKELDKKKGIGLIESKRIGLGQPNIYYVMNFASGDDNGKNGGEGKTAPPKDGSACGQFDHKRTAEKKQPLSEDTETRSTAQKCGNHISGNVKITSQEVCESHNRKCENHDFGSVKVTSAEVWNSHANNINANETDFSDTDSVHPSPITVTSMHAQEEDGQTEAEKKQIYREQTERLVKHQLRYYDNIRHMPFDEKALFEQTVDLIIDTICDEGDVVQIGQSRMPREVVKSRFLKLTDNDVKNVIDKVTTQSASEIKNMHKYMLTALYRETLTGHASVSQWVNHKLFGEEDDDETGNEGDTSGSTDQYMDFIKRLSEQNSGRT